MLLAARIKAAEVLVALARSASRDVCDICCAVQLLKGPAWRAKLSVNRCAAAAGSTSVGTAALGIKGECTAGFSARNSASGMPANAAALRTSMSAGRRTSAQAGQAGKSGSRAP